MVGQPPLPAVPRQKRRNRYSEERTGAVIVPVSTPSLLPPTALWEGDMACRLHCEAMGARVRRKKKGRFPRDTSAVLAVADVHFGSEQSVQGVLACTSVLARCTCRQLIEIQAGH